MGDAVSVMEGPGNGETIFISTTISRTFPWVTQIYSLFLPFFFSSILLLASQALLRGYSRVSLVVVRAKRQEGQDLAEISEKRQEGRRHAPVRFSAPLCLLRGIGRRGK